MIVNPFRNKTLRKGFDECVRSYYAQTGGIRYADGSRCKGNSIAGTFWLGFDNVTKGLGAYNTPALRNTLGYVYWRAGRAVAEKETV